jgi:hypothetical protein
VSTYAREHPELDDMTGEGILNHILDAAPEE